MTSKTHILELPVCEAIYAGIVKLAQKEGKTPTLYATLLFEATYSARVKPTGDRTLDEVVPAVLLLHGSAFDTDQIARTLHVSEAVVERIIQAWRSRKRELGSEPVMGANDGLCDISEVTEA